MDRTNKTILVFIANVFQLAFGFLQLLLLSRFACKTDFGGLQQVALVSTIVISVTTAVSSGMIYFFGAAAATEKDPTIVRFFISLVGASITAFAAVFLLSESLAGLFANALFSNGRWLVAVLISLRMVNSFYPNLSFVKEKLTALIASNLTQVCFFAGFVMAIRGQISSILVLEILVCVELIELMFLAACIVPLMTTKKHRQPITKKEWVYTRTLILSSVVIVIGSQIDRLLISAGTNPQTYSDYAVITFSNPLISVLIISVTTAFIPEAARLHGQKKIKELLALWKTVIGNVALISLPVIVYSVFFGAQLFILFFGQKFASVAFLFQLYNAKYFLIFVTVAATMNAVGLERYTFVNSLINCATTAAFTYLGIRIAGLQGAVIGGIVAIYLGYVLPAYIICKKLNTRVQEFFPYVLVLKTLLISLTLCFGVYVIILNFLPAGLTPALYLAPCYYLAAMALIHRYVSPINVNFSSSLLKIKCHTRIRYPFTKPPYDKLPLPIEAIRSSG